MSGHVIVSPVASPVFQSIAPALAGIAAGACVGLACAGLAVSVKRVIDLQAAAAVEHQQRERGKLKDWAAFQVRHRAESALLQEMEQTIQASEQRLMKLEIGAPAAASITNALSGPTGPVQRGAMALGRDRAIPGQVQDMLRALHQLVSGLPQEFRDSKDSPYSLLKRHHDALTAAFEAGESLGLDELLSFKKTIAGTLAGFRSELIARRTHLATIQKQMDTALSEVLFYEHLAASPKLALRVERDELAELRVQIVLALNAENVSQGVVETIEKRLRAIKAAIDKQVVLAAHNQALPESLAAHLAGMGYDMLDDAEQVDTRSCRKQVYRIPGGEQLHAVLHDNGQLGFEVVHERDASCRDTGPLSRGEAGLLHQQEQRWCTDLRELVRRLAAEGFPFAIHFEQAIPAGSVKVVVVETPEEILNFDPSVDYAPAVQKRYLA